MTSRGPGLSILVLLLAACETTGSELDASLDGARTDARVDAWVDPLRDGSAPDDVEVARDARAALDAPTPPLRDDALVPDWRWDEKVARVIDDASLSLAFADAGFALPPGSEAYAARIVAGVDGPAYELHEAGGGAFSEDFWPASTVKLLSAIAALEHVHELGFTSAAHVTFDSGFEDDVSAIVGRAIRVSSNIDYVRTFRITGFDRLNEAFLTEERGFPRMVLQRSYEAGVSVRSVPGFTLEEDGRSVYVPMTASGASYGCGADGNCASLFELGEGARRVVLDAEIPASERFAIAPEDRAVVMDALCSATPSFFASGVSRVLGAGARVCHKPGWVPDNDCLDHGVVEDPATGDRFLLAASVPMGPSLSDCDVLGDFAAHAIEALRAHPAFALQHDAGSPVVAQSDPGRITIEAIGADRVEVWLDGRGIGEVTGGPRFVVMHDAAAGEALLALRAWSGGSAVAYRSLRVAIQAR